MTYHLYATGRALRHELLATTILGTLALTPLVQCSQARAQTAESGAGALPTVDVTASQGGAGDPVGGAGVNAPNQGYSAPPVLQSTTKINVPTFDLPIAIQTVPEQVIQDQNDISIQDALQNVSGVRSANNNLEGYVFNLRGFRSVNVFRDGLLISDAIPQNYDTANLQTIEVLKGPASFVFGRADPGGVINLVTKKPLDVPYYSVTQEFGSFNLYRTVWDLTGPVQVPSLDNGALSYRFMGSYTTGGEFIDFINNRKVFLAPAVTWRIDPATTLTVDAQYTRQNSQSFVGIPALGMYPASLPVYRTAQEPNEPPDTVRSSIIAYEFKHNFNQDWTITNRFLAARATLEKDDLTANNFDSPPILDRGITYQKLTGTNYSANLDLTGKFYVLGARNDVLIGTDYFYSFYNYIFSADGSYPINIYNPLYGTVPTPAFAGAASRAWQGTADQFTSFSSLARKDLGVYAQDSITLFDNLHILLGARCDLADVRGGDGDNFAQASFNFNNSLSQHTAFFSPRVGVVYQPVPWLGFYGSYTRSFGQPNGIATDGTVFPPQIAEGWEGGAKAELLDGRLNATLAFFSITKSNILTPVPTALDPTAQRPVGAILSQGAELDVLGKLTNELSVIASYSHIDATIIADNSGLLGNSPRTYAPDSGSMFLAYEFPTDSFLHGWRAGGGVFAASNRWGDDANTFILPAYARFDAFAKYQIVAAGLKWSAQINLTNIANTKYYSGADNYFNNSPRFGIFPGAPRAVTASLRVEY
ncbi:TonB-dependent siderophore receptor [Beijerinckiaceae bacterium]|nr:TonB-dependent siderophore receptor [Beijerinckiaceae bacterium]